MHNEAVSCEPPVLNIGSQFEHLMVYSCPTLYTVGSTCNIWCKSGYPRAGTNTINCDFDASGDAVWHWDGFKPFCQGTHKNHRHFHGLTTKYSWFRERQTMLSLNMGYNEKSKRINFC